MFGEILEQENGDVIYIQYEKTCEYPECDKYLKANVIYYIGDERIEVPILTTCDEKSLHDLAYEYYYEYYYNVLGR